MGEGGEVVVGAMGAEGIPPPVSLLCGSAGGTALSRVQSLPGVSD